MRVLLHILDDIWPNLAAAALWGLPAFWIYYRRLRAQHRHLIDELREELFGDDTDDAY